MSTQPSKSTSGLTNVNTKGASKSEIKRLVAQSGAKTLKAAMTFLKETFAENINLPEAFEIIKDIPSLQSKKSAVVAVSQQPLQVKTFYVPTKGLSIEEAGKILDLAVEAGATFYEGVKGYHPKDCYSITNSNYVGVRFSNEFKTYLLDDASNFSNNDHPAVQLNNLREVEQYLRSNNKPKAVGQAWVANKQQTCKVKQKPVVSNKLLFTYATGQEFTVRGVTSAKVVVENDKTFVKYSAKRVGIEGFKTISEDVTIEVQGLIQVAYTNKDKNTQTVVFRDNKALSHIQAFDKITPQTLNL